LSRVLRQNFKHLLEAETGTIYKDPGGKITVCLISPNTYSVGMSSLGFQKVYHLLNSETDVVCERAFLPDNEAFKEHLRTGTELFSLESMRSVNRFHIVAFSVSFENDYLHIVQLLNLAKIPARASLRDENHPLVIMGGPCAFFNPEPVALFFDVVFVGEGEEMIQEFLALYRKAKDKNTLLNQCQTVKGLYVPSLYKKDKQPAVEKQWVQDISQAVNGFIITPHTEFKGMRLIEVQRGCPRKCRFCVAGFAYKPSRTKELKKLTVEIKEAGCARVGLVGPSLSDVQGINEVLRIEGVEFSLTSLRAHPDTLRLAETMQNRRSLSIAPEAGTEKMRKIINKGLTDSDIITSACMLLEVTGNLRLYFMIGLPGENSDDVKDIITLVEKIRIRQKKGLMTLSVSPFVPKPWTPFQWMPMEKPTLLQRKLSFLQKETQRIKGIKLHYEPPALSLMQAILARGDRTLACAIEGIAAGKTWKKAFKDKEQQMYRTIAFDEPLAWDFIDSGVTKAFLENECKKALKLIE
jgi:radical SAM superfamily enzyme YgiQ (UPF0313 family)